MSFAHVRTRFGGLSAPLSITNTISAQFLLTLTINNNIMNFSLFVKESSHGTSIIGLEMTRIVLT